MVWRIQCIMILSLVSLQSKAFGTKNNVDLIQNPVSKNEFKMSEIKIFKALMTEDQLKQHKNEKNKTLKKSVVTPLSLKVEVALSEEQQQHGLMFRKNLAEGNGMLFVFNGEHQRSFWMKNTLIPLSIGFADAKKTIFQISDLKSVKTLAQKTYDQVSSSKPAKYVIEVPQGWFKKNNLKPGSTFIWDEEKTFTP